MFNFPIKVFLFVSFALVLSACAQSLNGPVTAANVSPFDLNSLKMMVGVEADDLKTINDASKADIRRLLKKLDPADCPDGADYNQCIMKLSNKPNKFQSVSGITGRAFLRAARSLGNSGEGQEPTVDIRGQIVQQCLHDFTKPGYELTRKLNGDPKALRLCVYMETTVDNPGGSDPKVRYQYFHIEVDGNVGIDDGNGGTPDNGWPAAANQTGLTIPQKQGFNYKLYAWGDKILVKTYWEAKKLKNGAPDWDKYNSAPTGKPRIQAYFDPDPDACVDMLFELEVPDTMPVGYKGGVDYCLGRCKAPPVVNTR